MQPLDDHLLALRRLLEVREETDQACWLGLERLQWVEAAEREMIWDALACLLSPRSRAIKESGSAHQSCFTGSSGEPPVPGQ